MSDENDLTDILRRANPVGEYSIDDDRLSVMLQHALETQRHPQRRHGRHRRRHVTTALVSCTVAVVLVVAIAQAIVATPRRPRPLPVLTLAKLYTFEPAYGSVIFAPPASVDATAQYGMVPNDLSIRVGSQLGTKSSSSRVYEFTTAGDPKAELTTVARFVGIDGPIPVENDCGAWVIHDASHLLTSSCKSSSVPAPTWSLDNCLRRMECPAATGASDARLTQWSATLAATLLPRGATLGAPRFSRALDTITYPCAVSGVTVSNCSERFQYSSTGTLEYASGSFGPAEPFVSLGAYPLVSELAGARQIEDITKTSHTAEKSYVLLTTARLTYAIEQLKSGAWVLIPQYTYSGRGGVTVSQFAVIPADLRFPRPR